MSVLCSPLHYIEVHRQHMSLQADTIIMTLQGYLQ